MNGSLNLLLLFFTLLTGCQLEEKTQKEFLLELDHLLIFVANSQIEDQLKEVGFKLGDKLTTSHPHQGTKGQYFIFYNTFIEFLSLEDSTSAKANEERFGSSYIKRWSDDPDVCPIGLGLTMEPFDKTQTRFSFHAYQSLDNPSGEGYLMAQGNRDMTNPMIYVSGPDRAYQSIDFLSELEGLIQEPALSDFKQYLSHPNQVRRLSRLILTVPEQVKGSNLKMLKGIKQISIKRGPQYALDLIFDEGVQGKTISMEADIEIRFHY